MVNGSFIGRQFIRPEERILIPQPTDSIESRIIMAQHARNHQRILEERFISENTRENVDTMMERGDVISSIARGLNAPYEKVMRTPLMNGLAKERIFGRPSTPLPVQPRPRARPQRTRRPMVTSQRFRTRPARTRRPVQRRKRVERQNNTLAGQGFQMNFRIK